MHHGTRTYITGNTTNIDENIIIWRQGCDVESSNSFRFRWHEKCHRRADLFTTENAIIKPWFTCFSPVSGFLLEYVCTQWCKTQTSCYFLSIRSGFVKHGAAHGLSVSCPTVVSILFNRKFVLFTTEETFCHCDATIVLFCLPLTLWLHQFCSVLFLPLL